MDLENTYDRVNRKALWQVLRMYDVGGNLLNGTIRMYIKSLACVRLCHVLLPFQCVYGCSDERGENGM